MDRVIVAAMAAASFLAFAQTPATPRFEVASIRLNKSGDRRMMNPSSPGRFIATNIPLRMLIALAYDVEDFQLMSVPNWVNTDGYDIVATSETNKSFRGFRPMLQALLEERFKLIIRREMKELPVFALVVANTGARDRASFHQSVEVCAPTPSLSAASLASDQSPQCGNQHMYPSEHKILGHTVPFSELVTSLTFVLGRQVVDKTGLYGNFDFKLEWGPDPLLPGLTDPYSAGVEPGGTSIFTAIQEQLGLKLESTKGPVEVLVIDHVERSTEN